MNHCTIGTFSKSLEVNDTTILSIVCNVKTQTWISIRVDKVKACYTVILFMLIKLLFFCFFIAMSLDGGSRSDVKVCESAANRHKL